MFVIINKTTGEINTASNLSKVERFTGITYGRLRGFFSSQKKTDYIGARWRIVKTNPIKI